MPSVLVLCEYGSLNGGERSLLAVLDGVRAADFGVRVAAPPDSPLSMAVARRGIESIPLDLRDPSGSRAELSVCRQRLRAVIGAIRPDLVHANSLSTSRLAGPVVADMGVPSLGHLRDIIKVSAAAVGDLNRHNRLAAVSRATQTWYAALGVDPRRMTVLYNGVDLARFRPRPGTGDLHRELGVPPATPLIGFVGQIGIRKGLLNLMLAASRVRCPGVPPHLVIIGRRYSQKDEALEYERQVRHAADCGTLCGRVHFLGVRDDVDRLLNEFTLLAHPARQEPLGRVLLEAAAAGVAVVATDVGGTSEIFPAELRAAVLVPPDAPDSLAAAIGLVLEDPALSAALGRAARQRVEQMFDARQAAAALAAQYRELLG